MGAVILIIITWAAGTSPEAQIFVTPDMQQCMTMARSFAEAEGETNEFGPPASQEHFYVSCENVNGNDRVES